MGSIWTKSCEMPRHGQLEKKIRADAAVIGGGMAGVLTARALQRAGRKAVVLEAGRLGGGATGHTSAKVTAQHGLFCRSLLRALGEADARRYLRANQAAVAAFRRMVAEERIHCDWEDCPAALYGGDRAVLEAEAAAAGRLGLPVTLTADTPELPFPTAGAVWLEGQARFHPLKFLAAAAGPLEVYERTPVRRVEGTTLFTPGGRVEAGAVIFACHYPFVDFPGLYFARMYQQRSYVVALEHAPLPTAVYIGAGPEGLSLRRWGDYLLLGGGGHRTGEAQKGGYPPLLEQAERWFAGSRPAARWSAQDCMTPDGLPYVGRYAPSRPNWYVATGFHKWGMTGSMLAASLLANLVCGRPDPLEAVVSPRRVSAAALGMALAQGGQAAKGLARRFLPAGAGPESLAPGCGGVIRLEGETVGAWREADGRLCVVDLRCPHMGCRLEWNPHEKSWDCPCHGSRFDRYGRLLDGPAQKEARHG